MTEHRRAWFKRFKILTEYAVWQSIMRGTPLAAAETGLVPWSWQGRLIFAATIGLGCAVAKLAARFYEIKPAYGWAGWAFLLVIVLMYLEVANRFSDKP